MVDFNNRIINPDYNKTSFNMKLKNSPDGYFLEGEEEKENYDSDSDFPEYAKEDDEDEYIYQDDEDEDEEENNNRNYSPSALRLLIGMMLNPIEGWKKIRRNKASAEQIARNCFFPLTALAAASCFMECIYNSSTAISMAIVEAVKVFVALFFGNFLALSFVKILMPKDQKKIADSDFGKKYMMFLLSTLAIFFTLYECLPMVGPVIAFTPLWTIYLAMRGTKFFRFPEEKKNLLTALMCMIVIGGPFAVYWFFDLFMPG